MTVVVVVGVDRQRRGRVGAEERHVLGMPAHGLGLSGAADVPVDADHAIGGAQHHVEVVGDDQHAAAAPVPQPADQLVHGHLAGEVDLLDRLVEHQQVRVAQQRAGEQDPPELTARKAGELAVDDRRDPHLVQH